MLEQLLKYLLLGAIATTPLSGCAYMTKSGRQQMAYQRYVKKQSGKRLKMQKKIKPVKMPFTPGPSENKVNTEVIESPQSVTSGESQPSE
ncbi:MAG TPA: hypothetical protein VJ719_05445 [Chthoniobacterales bacterium]|nr:hypothetical protein [Chthoniobacterales bacterium]